MSTVSDAKILVMLVSHGFDPNLATKHLEHVERLPKLRARLSGLEFDNESHTYACGAGELLLG